MKKRSLLAALALVGAVVFSLGTANAGPGIGLIVGPHDDPVLAICEDHDPYSSGFECDRHSQATIDGRYTGTVFVPALIDLKRGVQR